MESNPDQETPAITSNVSEYVSSLENMMNLENQPADALSGICQEVDLEQ